MCFCSSQTLNIGQGCQGESSPPSAVTTHHSIQSRTFVNTPFQQLLAIIILTFAARFPPSLSLSFPFSLHLPLLAFFSFCFSSLGCVCDLIYALLSVSLIVFAHKYGRAARKYLSICEIQSKPFCRCLCPCCCCSCFA